MEFEKKTYIVMTILFKIVYHDIEVKSILISIYPVNKGILVSSGVFFVYSDIWKRLAY